MEISSQYCSVVASLEMWIISSLGYSVNLTPVSTLYPKCYLFPLCSEDEELGFEKLENIGNLKVIVINSNYININT